MHTQSVGANNIKKSDQEEVLEVARKRFQQAVTAEAEIRKLALEDLKFRAGDQWPEEIKRDRDVDRRPCLTINRIPQFIRQITNDQRQNRPSIKVSPVDDQADLDTAKVMQGLIRHIEYNSNADIAYSTAFEGAATKGIGYFRIVTDFVDEKSFDQEILIKRVRDSFSVYMDPSSTEPDGSDASWGFVFEEMPVDDYKEMYGDSALASMSDWASIGESSGWANEEQCRVAEYFYKSFDEVTICKTADGRVLDKSSYTEDELKFLEIIEERKTKIPKIHWCKINAVEVLEETVWPGSYIPIIPVLGDELFVDGKRVLEGIVRHAKDPQRMYNFWASAETETIALAPKAPFIGVEGQFEGHEQQWSTANSRNHAFLEYKAKSISGQPVGPPQRNIYEPPVQAISNARINSNEDIKATTGIYDATLGARSNENSGIAIQRRNHQSQTNNFHFIDNLSRSLRHAGRILVELIPSIYDTPRVARIIGEDKEEELIAVNQLFVSKDGKEKFIDLSTGKYDVTVNSGPSYETKRQEALDSMLALSQHNPQVTQVAGDIMIKNMDWPGAQEIAERFKKTIPPEILNDQEGEQIPPQVQAQMTQMNQMIEGLTAQLNEAQSKIDNKAYELESKERIELLKAETDLRIALLKEDSIDSRESFKAEIGQLDRKQQLLSETSGTNGAATFEDFNQPTGGFEPGTPVE